MPLMFENWCVRIAAQGLQERVGDRLLHVT